ncbi:hypothetical protein ACLB2K_008356 [Fragaria x ananassa]
MSNSKRGGTKFPYKKVKFEEQPTLQQSLKGGRLSNQKVEKQTWCFKSDMSREDIVHGGEYVQRNVAQGNSEGDPDFLTHFLAAGLVVKKFDVSVDGV